MRKALLLALLSLASPTFLLAEEPACERSESRITPAPDGRWSASVQEEACATATGASAGITVVLSLAGDTTRTRRVFTMPVPRSRDDWPRIRWLGADTMEIRVPNLTEAAAPTPSHEGIRIILAYCGDNPADRARLAAYKAAILQWQKEVSAWAEKRKQNAETAGPRPTRPEEPRLAPGRCTD